MLFVPILFFSFEAPEFYISLFTILILSSFYFLLPFLCTGRGFKALNIVMVFFYVRKYKRRPCTVFVLGRVELNQKIRQNNFLLFFDCPRPFVFSSSKKCPLSARFQFSDSDSGECICLLRTKKSNLRQTIF
jgi:hypothetical protein